VARFDQEGVCDERQPRQGAEYEARHKPIWSELETLKDYGVTTYTIFLHSETRQLFAYVEVEDSEVGRVTETSISGAVDLHEGADAAQSTTAQFRGAQAQHIDRS
jgi:hypothetical protein